MFENVEFDIEDGKLKVYLTSNAKVKEVKIASEDSIEIVHEFGSSRIRLPCPPEKIENVEDLGSGLYVVTVVPKSPCEYVDDEWHETFTTISSGFSDGSSSPRRKEVDVGDILLLEELDEEFEDLDEELKEALEEDAGEDDEEKDDDENVEEEGYDLYEKPIEDEEEVEDGVVVETGDDYEPLF
jgi:hypothetical protein